MKKMGKTAAAKFEKAFDKQFNEVEKVSFKLGDEEFEIDVYTKIAAADLNKLIKVATIAGYIDGNVDFFYRDCTIAKWIIEYFTSIPVPMIKIENDEIEDLHTCYDIVFGDGGLINKSDKLRKVVGSVISYSDSEIKNIVENDTQINKLCGKILELYELLQMEVKDIANNPATVDNMLKLIDGYLDNEKSDK